MTLFLLGNMAVMAMSLWTCLILTNTRGPKSMNQMWTEIRVFWLLLAIGVINAILATYAACHLAGLFVPGTLFMRSTAP